MPAAIIIITIYSLNLYQFLFILTTFLIGCHSDTKSHAVCAIYLTRLYKGVPRTRSLCHWWIASRPIKTHESRHSHTSISSHHLWPAITLADQPTILYVLTRTTYHVQNSTFSYNSNISRNNNESFTNI